jgi:hypothetical protein
MTDKKTFFTLCAVFFIGVLAGLGVATVLAVLVVKA